MIATLVICVVVLTPQNAGPAQAVIRGTVLDASGAVGGARVTAAGAESVTDVAGRFSVPLSSPSATIDARVRARGFVEYTAAVPAETTTIRIVLQGGAAQDDSGGVRLLLP